MEFDEYDYLEKAVEETNGTPSKKESPPPSKEKDRDRSDKGYRRRDRNEEDEFDEEERENWKSSSKKPRSEDNGRERDRDRDRERSSRHRSRDRESERRGSRDRDREVEKDRRSSRDRDREVEKDRRSSRDRDREVEKERRSSRDVEKDRRSSRDVEKDRRSSRDREPEAEKGRSSRDRDRDRERREREKEKERDRERRERDKEREREREKARRSRSRSRLEAVERDVGRERDREESRRYKDKKDAEPEADPERDQRTVFAYQMPLKATERDVFEFFSQAGKVRDVKLIMDRNSRRSKGVGYIEFVDVMSVPMAIALSGHLFLGQPIMVKPSEAEKNLVQSNTSTGAGATGQYGGADRKLYVGNLHFNMTEPQLKQIFEAFGPVELVQLPTDLETGHCKGFGFVQFVQLEHAKAAQSLNGKLEIAGRTIKVSCVTEHVGVQDSGAKTADFDDDDGGGLALNAQSRALLMQKLDRSGIASSVVGSLGVPALNGAAPIQQGITLPMNPAAVMPTPLLPAQAPIAPEPIGIPSECLLLKNMFDPATEEDPEFDMDIRDDVHEECSKYGRVKHIHVDKESAGYVYLRFESVEAASRAQQAMHHRWFARRLISAIYLQPYEYDAKFKGTA